jgi:Fur family transcriptional regulator, ferric uptake regulator
MDNESKQILKIHNLRHTDIRENILTGFLRYPVALSHGDIEGLLAGHQDRVTVYRTLKTFVETGILHKILDDQGGVKYGLCKNTCSNIEHKHNHVHFKCESCGNTTCLDKLVIPEIQLPEGYQAQEINMLVQGICESCNH